MSFSAYVPNPSGPGGTLTIYLNNLPVVVWDSLDGSGQLAQNGIYHIVLEERDSNHNSLFFSGNVVVMPYHSVNLANFTAAPNVAHNGDTIRLSASFSGAPADGRSQVKVYAVTGELARILAVSNGQANWDLRNNDGGLVASGVYILDLDGMDVNTGVATHKFLKVIVIR
jgi:hypothetical protein